MPESKFDRQKADVTNTATIVKKILLKTRTILTWLGRPVLFLLIAIVISIIAILWGVGKAILAVFDSIKTPPIKPYKPSITLKLPKLKIKLPTVNIRFGFIIRLWAGRVKLLTKVVLVLVFIACISAGVWFFLLHDLPKPGELVTRDQIVSTKIYDREGRLLYKIFRNQNRTLVHLDEIPLYTQTATIAIEDADFYSHTGFSTRGILRALVRNLTRGDTSGGSTITQQLVKNALLSPEKTFSRKIKEIVLAIRVELTFPKDQILEMYLNEVAYGGAAYGIEEASQLYFGKTTHELTLAESALLAGLPRAPSVYSPFGANPQFAKARQLEVLARMVQEGYITQREAEVGASEKLVFAPQRTDIKAPHFVMYVKELLAKKYGERMVEEGGLEVITSLDLDIQNMVEGQVFQETEKIKGLRISNGAALVTDPKTGEILAMVGSKDYFNTKQDGNFNVTTALRQPGSSIKPVNYSYALESGKFTAASMISDTPITYSIPGSEPYSPRNYDNRFRGNVPLRTALASSLNVPAVKVLASYGVEKMIEQAKKLGITTWNKSSDYGLSLTLGGGEVKMVDMATAYGTFANYGIRVDLQPILEITDYKGRRILENDCSPLLTLISPAYAAEALYKECGKPALDPRVAFILTNILNDNPARTPVFGPNSLLVIPNHKEVAVKTGTTQNLRDNWTIGYTQNYVVSAWVGNNDNTPMAYVASGVTGATPIWHNIMASLLTGAPNHSWETPIGVIQTNICSITGTLPCEGCPTKTEYFISGTEPKYHCSSEKIKEILEKKEEDSTSQE